MPDPTRFRFRPGVSVHVLVEDRSPFGSPLTPRPDESTRELFAPVADYARRHPGELLQASPALLGEVVAGEAFARVAARDGDGSWRLHRDVLFPPPELVRFAGLMLEDGERGVEVAAAGPEWPDFHDLISTADASDRRSTLPRAGGSWRSGAALVVRR